MDPQIKDAQIIMMAVLILHQISFTLLKITIVINTNPRCEQNNGTKDSIDRNISDEAGSTDIAVA